MSRGNLPIHEITGGNCQAVIGPITTKRYATRWAIDCAWPIFRRRSARRRGSWGGGTDSSRPTKNSHVETKFQRELMSFKVHEIK